MKNDFKAFNADELDFAGKMLAMEESNRLRGERADQELEEHMYRLLSQPFGEGR